MLVRAYVEMLSAYRLFRLPDKALALKQVPFDTKPVSGRTPNEQRFPVTLSYFGFAKHRRSEHSS